MTNEEIKQKLLQIETTTIDFTLTQTGKESPRVNGLYKPDTHEILLHNANFKTDEQLMYTAIHEFSHHLETEKYMNENGGKLPPSGSRAHSQAFWARFHTLLQKAEGLGFYKISLDGSEALKTLTTKIKTEYIEANGKMMIEFGKLLIQAHKLCEEANIRYEDYLERVLYLPKNTVKDLKKVATVQVNPAIGFDNMKKVAQIKKTDERQAAENQILAGKTPDTVEELTKKKATSETQKEKLEKEKNRLEKTIASLQQRLQFVEDTLGTL